MPIIAPETKVCVFHTSQTFTSLRNEGFHSFFTKEALYVSVPSFPECVTVPRTKPLLTGGQIR